MIVPGMQGRRVGVVRDFSSYLGEVEDGDLSEANVVTSELLGTSDPSSPDLGGDTLHAPVIDLDVPVAYVPSSTPGHGHLYVDVAMTAPQMWHLLQAMVDVGLVEEGFLNASKARGYTSVRLPWITKEAQPDSDAEEQAANAAELVTLGELREIF
jgi:hypothetical protein